MPPFRLTVQTKWPAVPRLYILATRPIFGIFPKRRLSFSLMAFLAIPDPIHDRRIIGLHLTGLIIFMSGLALIAELHFHPVFDIHDGRLGFPITFAFTHNFELFAKPIDGLAHQLIGSDTGL